MKITFFENLAIVYISCILVALFFLRIDPIISCGLGLAGLITLPINLKLKKFYVGR